MRVGNNKGKVLQLSEKQIEQIVDQVANKLKQNTANIAVRQSSDGVFTDMNDAVEAAHTAFLKYKECSIQCRKKYNCLSAIGEPFPLSRWEEDR